ncbi:MAG: DegT/DnrJ/EryC1/StrS family aminotransferase, partial [Saprospiraceae bacterium]|nr:DegT/DnrJ/EryC1/StrS family aminotransferase [Saprospiraceae bacterium]
AERAKHLSTTAKVAHPWEFVHNEVGYNYRMPNINAAIGVAQMEKISEILKNKKETAESYYNHFNNTEVECYFGNSNMNPNYWLNTIKFENESLRTRFLTETNANGIKTRPIWNLLSELPMYQGCQRGELINSNILEKTLVNLPSGFRS